MLSEKELLEAQLKVLGHEGFGFTEYRNIGQNKFVSINPRKTKEGRKNEDVSYITCLVIDIDPVRTTAMSTDEQHKAAIQLGSRIMQDLPCSVLIDSGSGAHVYLPINPIINENGLKEKLAHFYSGLRAKYETKELKIDHIQDAARMIRMWGSLNPKSNRFCVPIGIEGTKKFPRFDLKLETLTKQENSIILNDVKTNEDERFEQLCKIHLGLNRMMKSEGNFPSRSEADYAFICYLTKAHFSVGDIKRFARRNPIGRGSELGDQDVERIIGKVQADNNTSKSFIHSYADYSRGLEKRTTGYSTGFVKLDDMLSGLQKGRLYVIAARTNEGKTSLAIQIANNLINKGIMVLYFPTELGYEPLFDKIVAQNTEINLKQFQHGNFKSEEKEKINGVIENIRQFPFIVYEDFSLTLEKIKNKTKEILPQVIILDYIQAMKYQEGAPSEIAEVMRGLKQLNEELNIPIIVCCQLNRSAINSEINLSQLKGSGSIEEFSDVVMALSTLSRFEYPRPVNLYILKSRYSEIGKIRLDFYSSIGKFVEHENA